MDDSDRLLSVDELADYLGTISAWRHRRGGAFGIRRWTTSPPPVVVGVSLTPNERTMRARLAAHVLHASVDSREHTEPARRAFMARFEDQVDPDRVLSAAERARRAEHAKKAYFTRLALKSAQARRRKP